MAYEPHIWVAPPANPEVSIWRYLSFPRFWDLLERSQLHFARLDQFSDSWEGVLPPCTRALEKDQFLDLPIRLGDLLTDFQHLARANNRFNKLCSYANCWFMNEHESDAMWRLYSPQGVAIRSSFRRLCESLAREPEPIHVGQVQYLDYQADQPPTYGNPLAVAFNKSMEYAHEHELRAVVIKLPDGWKGGSPPYEEYRDKHPKFMKVAVDLNVLIECVHVAPGNPPALLKQVRDALEHFDLNKRTVESSLDRQPKLI